MPPGAYLGIHIVQAPKSPNYDTVKALVFSYNWLQSRLSEIDFLRRYVSALEAYQKVGVCIRH